ncbi:hypothetical protein UFOVP657_55 [uncultured Caudovirales phage]|uniref:Uncharacterized protein n=1 Tax=uncultured Caudovirales phage TaxID=2100421 RepID=A0A6J5MEE1_9CAUD|nr:hypothetical protein UFOVP467_56 [uncultured Caudovirales phage]CAB4156389.1 hypothetical protein UFOVP657_55 [uncultured Caudovirales phage]|tara:strand:+ start:2118 stop:2984 length:867 start_codon:yes stop_codon:yes gene_type:complete
MSDEMVMRTADSPAAATGDYAAEGLYDSPEGAADPNQWALNSDGGSEYEYADNGYDATPDVESEVRQQLYDNLLGDEPGSVPYERFREVNEQARQGREYQGQMERWADLITQLEGNGFQSASDLQNALQRQQLEQQEQTIREQYMGFARDEMMPQDLAEAKADAEIQRMRYDRVMNQMSEYMVSQQIDTALDQYPYARRGQDMFYGLVQNGMNPNDAAQFVHNNISGIVESMIPQLTQTITSRMSQPVPIDTSYSNQQVVSQPDPVQSRGAMSTISRLLGIGRSSNQL